MDVVEMPNAGGLVVVDGVLPTAREWEEIRTRGLGINVLRMPDSGESLAGLEPALEWLTRLFVNSSSCIDLRMIEKMPRLEQLAVGGRVKRPLQAERLPSLKIFGGPVKSFPGILDLPSLEEVVVDWSDSNRPCIRSPLKRVTLANARKLGAIPEFAHPKLMSTLVVHGAAHLSLRGISDLHNLKALHLDHCRVVEDAGELIMLPKLEALTFEDCPDVQDFWDLQPISAEVRIVGRNPFVSEFRSAVNEAKWTFPPSRRYLPLDESVPREFLAHPGLERALRVPEEASENNPWGDHLPEYWHQLPEPQQNAILERFLEKVLVWASREGANRAVIDGRDIAFDIRQLVLATHEHSVLVYAGERLLVSVPDGLGGGFLISSPLRFDATRQSDSRR